MGTIPKLSDIREDQRTDVVVALLEVINRQQEAIQQLKDEIARLKGQKPKPDIKPLLRSTYFWRSLSRAVRTNNQK